MHTVKKTFRLFSFSLFLLAIPLFVLLGYFGHSLPDIFRKNASMSFHLFSQSYITASRATSFEGQDAFVSSGQSNTDAFTLKLWGVIPVKTVTVENVDTVLLSPCGIPFGIKMHTDGVLVVGMSNIETENGTVNPAKDAGLEIGDLIVSLNETPVYTNEDVAEIVSQSGGEKIKCAVKRAEKTFTVYLTPQKSLAGNLYRIGVWVRDSSAGIGTLTYFDFAKKTFAGLGHGVCDVDTGELLPLMKGEIVEVRINDIVRGQSGKPGELRGVFYDQVKLGNLTKNQETGVFGSLLFDYIGPYEMPMAFRQEVLEGPAQIMTTTYGNTPKLYDIVIEKTSYNEQSPTKNMVIRITDPELLEKTGGIIQGMSGSPILQNDKIVGAVTHVFINDPTKGYGIFVENMYYSS